MILVSLEDKEVCAKIHFTLLLPRYDFTLHMTLQKEYSGSESFSAESTGDAAAQLLFVVYFHEAVIIREAMR